MRKAAVNICRFIVAATFIFSGFVKAVDPMGTQYKIEDYLYAWGIDFVPHIVALTASVALSATEFTIGILLAFAIRRRLMTLLAALMMVVMTLLTVWIAATNPVSDCGCFGEAIKLTNGETLLKNIVLLACAIVIWRWPLDMVRFLSKNTQWIVVNYTVVFILVISGYSLYTLPQIDFRPYHIGADVRQAYQEGHDDVAGLYVETIPGGDDITEEMLAHEGYTALLVAPFLETADDSRFDDINRLYDYATDNGYPFYCLTASGGDAIARWRDMTGAEYPFCLSDETVLKTMIRSNPGLMLLHDGKVVGKWGNNSLPSADDTRTPISAEWLADHNTEASKAGTLAMVALWFLLPLALLTIADRLWAWSSIVKERKKKSKIYKLFKKGKNMRKKIVAGNWKMNMNLQDGISLAKQLSSALSAEKPNCGVVICTPFIHLASIAPLLDQNVIALGAENCAAKAKGAYTGEVSAEMVKSTGAQYVILGHSERREYYNETPEILKEKVQLALANGLKIIFCIGESLQEREAGKQNEVVKAELEGSVFGLSADEFKNIVIAYEPIWAIGTGKTATADQAEEIHAYIRSVIAAKYGDAIAQETSILYGGSCKASNAPELFAKPDIDGGLIGGASLKCADFKGIIDAWK